MAFVRKIDLDGLNDEECRELAFNKLLASVAASEQSSEKLKRKLSGYGFPETAIEAALEKAKRIGAVDDERYCNCLIRSAISSGRGLTRIRPEIERLGFYIEDLEAYSEYEELGSEWEIEQAIDVLMRHPTRSKDVYSSCMRKLLSRGFSAEVASAASRAYSDSVRQ